MAEKKPKTLTVYNDLMAKLAQGNVAPVYLLMGEESYYIDKISEWIADHLLTEDERDFNLTMFYGSDVNSQRIMDEARRFPVMAERVVIIVKEAQTMKNLEKLEDYMASPVKSTVLVLCHKGGTIDSRKKIVTRAAANGVVFVSDPPRYDSDIKEFIKTYIARPEYDAKIDPRALDLMAAHIGGDLTRMTSELDKLLVAFAPGATRTITTDIIERLVGISKNYNVFELRDALINRDALRAHRIARYFDKNPKSGGLYAILPQLFSFYQNLLLAYYTPKPISETAIMAQLGLKTPWAVRDYSTAMRNYKAGHVLQIIGKIRETDARSKGLDNINTPPGELLKELITFILA